MKTAIFALAILLTGCATCRNHPVACGAAYVVLAGSIVASQSGHNSNGAPGDVPQRASHIH